MSDYDEIARLRAELAEAIEDLTTATVAAREWRTSVIESAIESLQIAGHEMTNALQRVDLLLVALSEARLRVERDAEH